MSEELKAFSKRIAAYKKGNTKVHYLDDNLIQLYNEWDIARVFLELIHQSEVPEIFDLTKLQNLQYDYQKKTSISIDSDGLIEKQWIRLIWGEVRISSSIVSALFRLKDLGTEKEVSSFIKDNQEELSFINEIHKEVGHVGERRLLIDIKKAKNIINKYKRVYSACPTFEDFKSKKFFENYDKDTDKVMLNLQRGSFTGHNDRILDDYKIEIIGSLWEKMLENAKEEEYSELLITWVRKVLSLHLWDLSKMERYVKKDNLEILKEEGLKLIINSEDIRITEREIDKYWWDNETFRFYDGHYTSVPSVYEIDNTSHFKLYKSLETIERYFSNNPIFSQPSRTDVGFLIRTCMHLDTLWGGYSYVKKLLNISLERPYLLRKIVFLISENYPEVIPYMLQDDRFAGIGMEILLKLKLKDELFIKEEGIKEAIEIEKIISKFWLSGLEQILKSAYSHSSNYELSEVIIQVFKPLLDLIYQNRYVSMIDLKSQEIHIKRYNEGISLIENYKNGNQSQYPNLFLKYIDSVLGAVKDYPKATAFSEIISPSLEDFTLLVDIYTIYARYLNDKKFSTTKLDFYATQQNKIVDFFLQLYRNYILTEEVDVIGHTKISKRKTKRIRDYRFTELVEWEIILTAFYKNDLLDDFFDIIREVKFTGSKKEGKYDEGNRDSMYKIRFHLTVLLASFEKLENSDKYYTAESKDLSSEIKSEIIKISCKYNKFDLPKVGDVFEEDFRINFGDYSTSLLKKVFQISNLFESHEKKKLIKSFAKNNADLNRFLIIYNSFLSEIDKNLLKKEIGNIDFQEYIDSAMSLSNVEITLIETVNSEIFADRANEILEFYQSFVTKNNIPNKENLLFEIQLIISYRKKDETAIKNVKNPFKRFIMKRTRSLENRRYFILGLLKFDEKKFEQALALFDEIYDSPPNKKMGRLAALLEIAKQKIERNEEENDLRKQYNSYIGFEKQFKKKGRHVYFNKSWSIHLKLECCAFLKSTLEFKNIFYTEINEFDRTQESFLKIAVPFFAENKEEQKALDLIQKSESYYSTYNVPIPPFIEELRALVSNEKTPQYLRSLRTHFKSISTLSLKDKVSVVPQNINKYGEDLGKFLLFEICKAFQKLLTKIKAIENNFVKIVDKTAMDELAKQLLKVDNSIAQINLGGKNKSSAVKKINEQLKVSINRSIIEDEFTDLFELVFNAQLSIYNVKYDSQRRTGSSPTRKASGEADLVMSEGLTEILIEAVRVYPYKNSWTNDKNRVKAHIVKMFDYVSDRKLFYNVVYYQNSDFINHWTEFKESILPKVKFPAQFALLENDSIEDMKDFGNTSIKVVLSKHEQDLQCYHIFVNMGYIISNGGK